MGEWILLNNEAELEAKAKVLKKKCRGHYFTNYYFLNSTRDNDLRYTEMFYQTDGDNLYAIERMDEFYQLFYFVGDVDAIRLDLPPSVARSVLTCEIDEEEGKEKQGLVVEKLYAAGFSDYKKYHFYDRKGGDVRKFHRKGIDTTYQASVEELSIMYDIFDPYSDDMPLKKAFPEYLASMNIASCAVNGQYAGSCMISKRGWGYGYIFVHKNFSNGGGIGMYLLSACLEKNVCKNPNRIIRATIEDNNIRSIRLHKAFDFELTKQYHTVLIRRP